MSAAGRWALPQLEALAVILRALHPDDRALLAAIEAGDRLDGAPREGERGSLVDAETIAAQFDVRAPWVRRNADRLGVVRLGNGPRPRLRFDPARVATELTAGVGSKGSERQNSRPQRRKRRRRSYRTGTGVELLPIRGEDIPFQGGEA